MKKLFVFCLLLMLSMSGFTAGTNFLWSANTTSNAIYTNVVGASNAIYVFQLSNTTFMVSNTVYSLTNGAATTNIGFINNETKTNWMRITNGFVRGITNAAP